MDSLKISDGLTELLQNVDFNLAALVMNLKQTEGKVNEQNIEQAKEMLKRLFKDILREKFDDSALNDLKDFSLNKEVLSVQNAINEKSKQTLQALEYFTKIFQNDSPEEIQSLTINIKEFDGQIKNLKVLKQDDSVFSLKQSLGLFSYFWEKSNFNECLESFSQVKLQLINTQNYINIELKQITGIQEVLQNALIKFVETLFSYKKRFQDLLNEAVNIDTVEAYLSVKMKVGKILNDARDNIAKNQIYEAYRKENRQEKGRKMIELDLTWTNMS